jgi:arsenate reductase (thioredoxin)
MQKQKILFVCRGNVGRSQIAEALLKKIAGDAYEITSAGTKLSGSEQPIGELAPAINEVVEVMKEAGVDVSQNIRTQVTKEMADASDKVVLVVDDDDPIPDYLLNNPKVIRWDVLDPKGQTLEFTRSVRDQIDGFVNEMVEGDRE